MLVLLLRIQILSLLSSSSSRCCIVPRNCKMESLSLSSSTYSSYIHSPRRIFPSKRATFLTFQPPTNSLKPATLSFTSHSLSLFKPKQNHPITPLQHPIRTSSTPPPPPSPSPSPPLKAGAKLLPLIISVSLGLVIRFLVPKPVEVPMQGWQLLAIFLSTNLGLILSPLPIGAWAFLSITTLIATKTLTFADAFKGFTSEVIWLITISFFFARGIVKTGLGSRIATYFVKWFGKSALGLSYGLVFGEMLVAPAMPSVIARAGGVFLPIIKSTLLLSGGEDKSDPSTKKLGSYLFQSQLQSAGSSGALFLTGAGYNLLCLKLAEELGVKIANPWITWFKAASLPSLVSLIATPYILYKVFPPESDNTLDAPAMAASKLEQMGPVSKNEWVMMGTILLAVSLWIFGEAIGIASVVAAMLGLSILLILGVVEWEDCLKDKSAWDTLTWFSILVGMASQLTNLGIVAWMSNCVAKFLQSFSLNGLAAFGVLHAAYFFIHYIFASQAAHVGALYSSFLAMHMASGVPGVLAALSLAFNTSLFGGLTHYSSAQAAAYYGAGYIDVPDFFRLGFTMALVNAVIWGGVGTLWWKYLGLF